MQNNIDVIEFPDKVFEGFLLENFDYDQDGQISAEDASRVVSMQIDGTPARQIMSLQGIEYFVNLRQLTVQHTSICTLDVSRNKNLEHLDCMENRLLRLNLGRLNQMTRLYCDGNRLERLDVSGLPSLKLLHCTHNRLTELDLANKRQLIVLLCGNNLLTKLDVSGLPLMFVRCENNQLTELNLSANRHLIDVQFNGNPLQRLSLPARYDSGIEEIICDTRQLETVKQHYTDLWDKVELNEVPTPQPQQGKLFAGCEAEVKVDFIPTMLAHDIEVPEFV